MFEELGVSIPENDTGTFSSLLMCPNPDHQNSRSPAFQVNLVKPMVHCFSRCGVSGSYEHAVQTILGCDEREARRFMLRFTRVATLTDPSLFEGSRRRKSSESLVELGKDLERFRRGEFTFVPKEARSYLGKRGVNDAMIGRYQIGWDEDGRGDHLLEGRVVLPAFDHKGVLRFLIRRAIDDRQPKYVYSRGATKTDILFGLNGCLPFSSNQRILSLVEGSLDTIRLQHELGGTVGGTLGSGLSERQVKIVHDVRPSRVYTWFDKDEAGVHNTLDAIEKLQRFPVFVCRWPKNRSDPAELLRAEALRMMDRAIPAHEFVKIVKGIYRRSERKVKG